MRIHETHNVVDGACTQCGSDEMFHLIVACVGFTKQELSYMGEKHD
jgi:hypothetical protein